MTQQQTKGRAWFVCSLAVITSVVMGLNYYCVPATMGFLMEDFGIGETLGGWLFTACLIVSLVFALPGGALVDKFGPTKIGIIGLCCTTVGAILGALAPSYEILLASRVIQGIGPALMTVCVPVLISAWFAPEKRGFLMTIFSLWIGLGILLVFNVSNLLVIPDEITTWRSVWWFCAAVTVAIGVIYAVFVRMPEARADANEAAESQNQGSLLKGFKSLPTWLLAIAFVGFAFGVDSFTTFAPLYMQDVLGVDPATANTDASLITVGMVFGGFVMAFIMNKVVTQKARLRFMVVGVILTVCTYPIMYSFGADSVVLTMLIIGIILQIFPAIAFTIGPETAIGPAYVGAAMGIVALSQSLGIGGVISGAVIETMGYSAMGFVLVGIGVVELLAAIGVMVTMRRRRMKEQAPTQAMPSTITQPEN